jgi:hypothetical protein
MAPAVGKMKGGCNMKQEDYATARPNPSARPPRNGAFLKRQTQGEAEEQEEHRQPRTPPNQELARFHIVKLLRRFWDAPFACDESDHMLGQLLAAEPAHLANVKAGIPQHATNGLGFIELLAMNLLTAAIGAPNSPKRGNSSSQSPGAKIVLILDQASPVSTFREGLFTPAAAAGEGYVENQKTARLKRVKYVAIGPL